MLLYCFSFCMCCSVQVNFLMRFMLLCKKHIWVLASGRGKCLLLWCPLLCLLYRENQAWTWIPHYKEQWVTCNDEHDLVLQYGVKLQTSSFKTVLFIVKGSLYGLDFWLTIWNKNDLKIVKILPRITVNNFILLSCRGHQAVTCRLHIELEFGKFFDIPPQLVNCGAILGFDCIQYMCFYLWLSVAIWIGSVIHNILA